MAPDFATGLRPARRWAGNLLALAVSLGLVAGAWLWRHHSHVRGLRFHDAIAGRAYEGFDYGPLTGTELARVGLAHHDGHRPTSSYLGFAQTKPAGTYRVGLFGCSWVFGAEAPPGRDPASRLQRRLHALGRDHMEVLNFGIQGAGLQQFYLLWEALAPRYDLDLVVFGLHAFHFRRDRTFVHLPGDYGPVHARHVLDGDGLRLVAPPGPDLAANSTHYFRAPTPWRYLRYDHHPPAVLRSLVPAGRELTANPFYYHPDPDAEVQEIYARLIAKVAERARRVLVACDDPVTCAFRERVKADNVAFVDLRYPQLRRRAMGLLTAPLKHPSALGYDLAAEELALLLTGGDPAMLTRPALRRPDREPTAAGPIDPLHSWTEVGLRIGGREASVLVQRGAQRRGRPVSYVEHGIAALLDVSSRQEMRFLGLRQTLTKPAALDLTFDSGGQRRRLALASVASASGIVIRLPVDRRDPRLAADLAGVELVLDPHPAVLLPADLRADAVAVELAGRTLFVADGEQRSTADGRRLLALRPRGPLLWLRGHRDQDFGLDFPGPRGSLDLVLRRDGEEVSLPFARYRLDRPPAEPSPGPYPWPIPRRSGTGQAQAPEVAPVLDQGQVRERR